MHQPEGGGLGLCTTASPTAPFDPSHTASDGRSTENSDSSSLGDTYLAYSFQTWTFERVFVVNSPGQGGNQGGYTPQDPEAITTEVTALPSPSPTGILPNDAVAHVGGNGVGFPLILAGLMMVWTTMLNLWRGL